MKIKTVVNLFKDGLWSKNPLFMQVLDVCASLAITKAVSSALYMWITVTEVLY